MFDVMDEVLRLQSKTQGKLPLTLVVLDEMQQYIGEDNAKALAVQNIVEGCSARFASQVLVVATGQSDLGATPTLQKLIDRFPVQVALSDNDVETVVREVVLRKKPERVPTLKATLENVLRRDRPPPRRHPLSQPRAEEKPMLVPDYPLLPNSVAPVVRDAPRYRPRRQVRRARAIPARTRSTRRRSSRRGSARSAHVIGADYLFFDDKTHVDMLMSGVLLRRRSTTSSSAWRPKGADGAAQGVALCALIFLISQMSRAGPGWRDGPAGNRAVPC